MLITSVDAHRKMGIRMTEENEMITGSLDMVSIEELSVEDLPETLSAGTSSASSYACIGSAGTCAGTLSTLSTASK